MASLLISSYLLLSTKQNYWDSASLDCQTESLKNIKNDHYVFDKSCQKLLDHKLDTYSKSIQT